MEERFDVRKWNEGGFGSQDEASKNRTAGTFDDECLSFIMTWDRAQQDYGRPLSKSQVFELLLWMGYRKENGQQYKSRRLTESGPHDDIVIEIIKELYPIGGKKAVQERLRELGYEYVDIAIYHMAGAMGLRKRMRIKNGRQK